MVAVVEEKWALDRRRPVPLPFHCRASHASDARLRYTSLLIDATACLAHACIHLHAIAHARACLHASCARYTLKAAREQRPSIAITATPYFDGTEHSRALRGRAASIHAPGHRARAKRMGEGGNSMQR